MPYWRLVFANNAGEHHTTVISAPDQTDAEIQAEGVVFPADFDDSNPPEPGPELIDIEETDEEPQAPGE